MAYYEVVDLGTLSGYSDGSSALSINDNGQIVGEAFNNSSGSSIACLFDTTGGGNNINLGTLLNGQKSIAYSINNNGQIVGFGDPFACIFDSTGGGNNINLGPFFPSCTNSYAYSINDNGQIVGYLKTSSPIPQIPYLEFACTFDPSGSGAHTSFGEGVAYSINNNGQIVGVHLTKLLVEHDDYACIFDQTSGGNIRIGEGIAYSINNNGQIVGSDSISSWGSHACLFDPNGPDINLGTISGYQNSVANAINDIGQIVGWVSAGLPPVSAYRACLFDSTGGGNNIDLNTLVDPSSGWMLTKAYDINNDGWIVGGGTHDGQPRAFLLVTPEPVSAAIFGLGAVIISLRRKRRQIYC